MHMHCEIYAEKIELGTTNIVEVYVEKAMAPYHYDKGKKAFAWDWYQIGGRYMGSHDDHNPRDNPNNHETCWLCDGTGKRMDMVVENGCNGCKGTGVHFKWPTEWEKHQGDVMKLSEVKKHLTAYALIIPNFGQELWMGEWWNGEQYVKTGWDGKVLDKLKEKGLTDGYLITVDYHE